MTMKDLIQKILEFRPDLTKDKIDEMIRAKMEEAKGFLTFESAVRAVATDLGIEPTGISFEQKTSIKDLVSGLGDVTIVARVIFVGPLQKFTNPDGRNGSMRHLVVADKTGELMVVLWDSNADTTDPPNILGRLAQFSHGYVRLGLNNNLELIIGSKGSLKLISNDLHETAIPTLTFFHKKIKEMSTQTKTVNVIGAVAEISAVSTFSREDGGSGQLQKIEIEDETGSVSVVFWNTKVQELADVKVGSLIQVFGAKVKEAYNGGIELHVDSSTNISVLNFLPLGYEGFSVKPIEIRNLKPGLKVTVEGKVASQPLFRDVTTSKNEKVRLASFELEDKTGKISVFLWRDCAALAEGLSVNTKIRLRRVYVDYGSFGRLILSSSLGTNLDRI
ncbi:hypothetical protein KEJ33_05510 [Candidatus Bathyarchaeota archaeon]|nr:hypothetical protein [Candidatus Bathyarchaeota archaeon]